MYQKLKGSIYLLLAAAIWGIAFVAQSAAADQVEPFTFNCIRSWIATVVLLAFLLVRGRIRHEPLLPADRNRRKALLLGGAACGAVMFIAAGFQQSGITAYPEHVASSGRSGFITALYVVMVPLVGIFFRKKIHWMVGLGVALSVAGMYFLCFTDGIGGLYLGDVLVFCCALAFTAHILTVDHFIALADGVKLSCIQFFVTGALSCVMMVLTESPDWAAILDASIPLLYAGVMSSGVAYTLQILGQKDTDPTVASLLMSLESVFAGLGGWWLLHERLSGTELLGCGLVFGAVVLAQVPGFFQRNVDSVRS
jgi:drug/metabolite transporter (DMT)-like permease